MIAVFCHSQLLSTNQHSERHKSRVTNNFINRKFFMYCLGTISTFGYPIPSSVCQNQSPNAKPSGPEPVTMSAFLEMLSPSIPKCSRKASLSLTSHFLQKKKKSADKGICIFSPHDADSHFCNSVLPCETELLVIQWEGLILFPHVLKQMIKSPGK